VRARRLPLVSLAVALVLAAAAGAASGASRDGSGPVQVIALAVAEDSAGTFVGVHATVEAQALAGGSGQVYVSTKPLAQTDMQGSARLAARVAAATLGVDWDDYDYLVSFRSDSAVIGGPSAGAVMTLALATALHNLVAAEPWTLDAGVAATGTINPDGTVGPVGGIPAKAEGAKAAGIRHFLYPAGLDVATTQVAGRTVAVDLEAHCEALELECSPAASLVDLLRAAGIDVDQPEAPVPGTTDYREDLEPGVQQQVEDLESRLDALAGSAALGRLPAGERADVQEERAVAEDRLADARDALAEGRYYLAATRSFQGHIQAGRAENLTLLYDASTVAAQQAVVAAALQGCRDSVAAAKQTTDGLQASGITALYAVGSAQQRTAQAEELLEGAEQLAAQRSWGEAVFASTFCVERAGTADWWAALRGTFGSGPSLGDRDAFVEESLEAARESVAYGAAVLGAENVVEASGRLAAAEEHAAQGRRDAAVLDAIEAQTSASVAMQTAGGGPVPQAVLDAAEQSAARAIDTARSQGVEPMLSVSLVELSQDQNQTAQALANLWSARSLALLDRAPPPATFGGSGTGGAGDDGPLAGAERVTAAILVGAIVGGGLVAAVCVLVLAMRRRP
jgi:uncharacterized protein